MQQLLRRTLVLHSFAASNNMNHISIGKIVATFGLNGEIILKHSLGKKTALKNIEVVFIEDKKESRLPYFVQTSKAKTETEMYIQFDGVATKEAAQKLLNKRVWITEEEFKKIVGKQSPIALLGYSIIDDNKNIGAINEVIEQPHQILVRILINDKEAFIPLHEASLKKIDHKKKEVHVELPDGLLEIYLE
jgi:16S rRNA processing protein RimM